MAEREYNQILLLQQEELLLSAHCCQLTADQLVAIYMVAAAELVEADHTTERVVMVRTAVVVEAAVQQTQHTVMCRATVVAVEHMEAVAEVAEAFFLL